VLRAAVQLVHDAAVNISEGRRPAAATGFPRVLSGVNVLVPSSCECGRHSLASAPRHVAADASHKVSMCRAAVAPALLNRLFSPLDWLSGISSALQVALRGVVPSGWAATRVYVAPAGNRYNLVLTPCYCWIWTLGVLQGG
jgi:hypothetical protein